MLRSDKCHAGIHQRLLRVQDIERRALNEVVLEKTMSGHTVRLALAIDDEPLVTYAADGLIIATPTCSTAYNLSVRGPLSSPTHRASVVTPGPAHMLSHRALVVPPGPHVPAPGLAAQPPPPTVQGPAGGRRRAPCGAGVGGVGITPAPQIAIRPPGDTHL